MKQLIIYNFIRIVFGLFIFCLAVSSQSILLYLISFYICFLCKKEPTKGNDPFPSYTYWIGIYSYFRMLVSGICLFSAYMFSDVNLVVYFMCITSGIYMFNWSKMILFFDDK